jgi:hypothetical protein
MIALALLVAVHLASDFSGSKVSKNLLVVNVSNAKGPPTYRGSGVLYGFSADATQPPSNYSLGMKLQYYRGGRYILRFVYLQTG